MDEIEKNRKEIDEIDNKLLELFDLRAEKVKKITEIKNKNKKPIFDPSREKKIIDKLTTKKLKYLKREDIELIMNTIFKIYRGLFRPLNIAFLGPEGTFTHQAALKKFGNKCNFISEKAIEDVFKEVEKGSADYGVVPIENSMEGVVSHTVDMFVESNVKITSEILLEIHHYLLSKEKSIKAIKKIFSHPQAFSQCRRWILTNFGDVEMIEVESTTSAVKKAKKIKNSGAIASEIASYIYKLPILAERIEDFTENITRFLVIGKECPEMTGNDKTSIIFSIKDKVGALYNSLYPFKEKGINLTRLESRPSKKKAWDYIFFVDFIGHKDEEKVKEALMELEKNCVFLKILGSYPVEGGKNVG